MWLFIALILGTSVARAEQQETLGGPEEMEWEAWLFTNQEETEQTSRRITPKSVFIAPSFSIDQLPDCAEGYKPDAKGRCVKVVHVNKPAHFNFLLQRLNTMLGTTRRPNIPPVQEPEQFDLPIKRKTGESEAVAVMMADINTTVKPTTIKETDFTEKMITMWDLLTTTESIKDITETSTDPTTTVTDDLQDTMPTTGPPNVPNPPPMAPVDIDGSLPMLILSPRLTSIDSSDVSKKSTILEKEVSDLSKEELELQNDRDQIHFPNRNINPLIERIRQIANNQKKLNLTSEENPNSSEESKDYPHKVRFPGFVRYSSPGLDKSDDTETIHLFKGNYVKFPTSALQGFKPDSYEVPEEAHKATYWWMPTDHKVNQPRYRATLLRFWSRLPQQSSQRTKFNPSEVEVDT